ncbi:MAG: cysteine hydrolase, partial [Deltaproteobacteria bacterium]|nr:cysteine hydrolase [Deltaproteobacteria bacterium]
GLLLYLGLPTNGPRIGSYANPKVAVLVVDIQEDYTGPNARRPYRDGTKIVQATNSLIGQAQEHGALVGYVANVFENPVIRLVTGGINAPGAPGTEIDARITRLPGAPTFKKGRGDAFSNPALDAWLRQNQVDRLVIVGLDAAHCVNATTRGALNRGYQVTLVTDGIATESRRTLEDLAREWQAAGAVVRSSMEW